MKTNSFATLLLGFFTLMSCNQSDELIPDNNEPLTILSVDSEGTSTLTRTSIAPIFGVTDPLSADEIEFLFAIREDEKLAHDLYSVFAERYPTAPQIARIKKAEESHIACVEAVFDYYEVTYPTTTALGVFENDERQTTYNQLVEKSGSLLEVFNTMATLEEESVAAYQSVLSSITKENISLIISNMIKASSNHLKATVRQIIVLGGTYNPTYLSSEEFNAIVNAAFQQGNAYGQKKGQNAHGGNTNAQKSNREQSYKGGVNGAGTCTGTANGSAPGTGNEGGVGKRYRGGK